MSEWTAKIAGCFGVDDLVFAGHQADEDRAFELLSEIRKEHVDWVNVESGFRSHLQRKGAVEDHIENQISRIKEFYKVWLPE